MSYLIYNDYRLQIQNQQLQQIITADPTVLSRAEITSETEVKSYLVQKYETGKEFTNTGKWNYAALYKASNRVYLDAYQYNSNVTYNTNDIALNSSKVYQANEDAIIGAFDTSKWTLLGNQYDLYFAIYPNPLFDVYAIYMAGDIVFWNDQRYKCLTSSIIADELQYGTYSSVPLQNYFPDQPGQTQWESLGDYSIPANTAISNATYWASGDNRNQQVLLYTIDICLYHIHCRIAPNNIPTIRQNRYDDAIAWLRMAAQGSITADILKVQPKRGARIRFGGNVKNENNY